MAWEIRRATHRVDGFTLLELLVVLVLATVLVGLVVPRITGSLAGVELKGGARQLAAGLRYARSEAVASQKEVALVLDLDKRQFHITAQEQRHALPDGIKIKVKTAESEVSGDRRAGIRFFPDGTSTGGRITLAGSGGNYAINVDWLTGRVTIGSPG